MFTVNFYNHWTHHKNQIIFSRFVRAKYINHSASFGFIFRNRQVSVTINWINKSGTY